MKNLRISMKLALAFGAAILLLIALAIAARVGLGKTVEVQHEVLNDRYPKIELATNILDELSFQARAVRNIVILDDAKDRQNEWAQISASRQKGQQAYDKLIPMINSPAGRVALDAALAARQVYVKALDDYGALLNASGAKAGDPKLLHDKLLKELRPALTEYEAKLRDFIKVQKNFMDLAGQHAVAAASTANAIVLGATLLGVLLAVGAAVAVTRSVTGPINEVVSVLGALSKGDLSAEVRVDRKDEIGKIQEALHQLRDSLGNTVHAVRQNAESVATASAQIAQGNQDLSHRTEEQASALEQTAATMEQLGSTVRTNADSAKQANQLAQGAARVATHGGEVVGQVVNTMEGISESSRKIVDLLGGTSPPPPQPVDDDHSVAVTAGRTDERRVRVLSHTDQRRLFSAVRLVNSCFCSSFNKPSGSSVRNGPGAMQLTLMPNEAHSLARASVMRLTAVLVTALTLYFCIVPSASTTNFSEASPNNSGSRYTKKSPVALTT